VPEALLRVAFRRRENKNGSRHLWQRLTTQNRRETRADDDGDASASAESSGAVPTTAVTNGLGLQVIRELGEATCHPVEIIFLHGLGGSRRGTWQHPSGTCWPEWLVSDPAFNGVRIALWGYNANTDFFKPNTTHNIRTFATQLLLHINQRHRDTRPVNIAFDEC
jgi:hypothetical protein